MSPPRTYGPQDWIVPAALAGEMIVQISQIAPDTVKALDKLVRTGVLVKWRGKWNTGMPWGLGPDKTCWGLKSKYAPERRAA
jgi:hypothetical protein